MLCSSTVLHLGHGHSFDSLSLSLSLSLYLSIQSALSWLWSRGEYRAFPLPLPNPTRKEDDATFCHPWSAQSGQGSSPAWQAHRSTLCFLFFFFFSFSFRPLPPPFFFFFFFFAWAFQLSYLRSPSSSSSALTSSSSAVFSSSRERVYIYISLYFPLAFPFSPLSVGLWRTPVEVQACRARQVGQAGRIRRWMGTLGMARGGLPRWMDGSTGAAERRGGGGASSVDQPLLLPRRTHSPTILELWQVYARPAAR